MKQLKFNRYHCYNKDGKKIGKRVEIGQTPDNLPDHTNWVRGTGQFSEEALEKITQAIRAKFCGVPKSAEQRAKMRQAKLGVPKSEEHRKHMCEAQQRRWYG